MHCIIRTSYTDFGVSIRGIQVNNGKEVFSAVFFEIFYLIHYLEIYCCTVDYCFIALLFSILRMLCKNNKNKATDITKWEFKQNMFRTIYLLRLHYSCSSFGWKLYVFGGEKAGAAACLPSPILLALFFSVFFWCR